MSKATKLQAPLSKSTSLLFHYLSIYLSIYLPIYLSIYLSIYPPTNRSIYLSIYLSNFYLSTPSLPPVTHALQGAPRNEDPILMASLPSMPRQTFNPRFLIAFFLSCLSLLSSSPNVHFKQLIFSPCAPYRSLSVNFLDFWQGNLRIHTKSARLNNWEIAGIIFARKFVAQRNSFVPSFVSAEMPP